MKRKIGILFVTAGIISLILAGLFHLKNINEDNRAMEISNQGVPRFLELIPSAPVYAEEPESGSEDATFEIDGQLYIGVLSIPALSLELLINAEWSMPLLKLTPCRYSGSVYDALVIAAHNYNSHFGKLNTLNNGDEVIFIDALGIIHSFKVVEIMTVKPASIDEVVDSAFDLTFFTCNYNGNARVVVRCMKNAE